MLELAAEMDNAGATTLTSPASEAGEAVKRAAGEVGIPPLLVPIEVSRRKLNTELSHWRANSAAYRRRGWLLLDVDLEELKVDVGFLALAAFGDAQLHVMTACIRLHFDNYDLWPPSLTFVDPRTGELAAPPVQAIEPVNEHELRNSLLVHPVSGLPFLCMPGVREYHTHPQHTGDDWLLHRANGDGSLAVVCDRVWRRMVRNVIGLQVALQSIPTMGTQLNIALVQGNIEGIPGRE